MDQKWFDKLKGRKFLEGRPEQLKHYSEAFKIRLHNGWYYISWTDSPRQVYQTPGFVSYSEAKHVLEENWQKYLDEEFEKEILDGSEEYKVNPSTEG